MRDEPNLGVWTTRVARWLGFGVLTAMAAPTLMVGPELAVGWTFVSAFTLWTAGALLAMVPPRGASDASGAVLVGAEVVLPPDGWRQVPRSDRAKGLGPLAGVRVRLEGLSITETSGAPPAAGVLRRLAERWALGRLALAIVPAAGLALVAGPTEPAAGMFAGWLLGLTALEVGVRWVRWRRLAVVTIGPRGLRVAPVFGGEARSVELHRGAVRVAERGRSFVDDIGAIKLDVVRQATVTVHGERFVAVGEVVAELLAWAGKGDPAPYR